MDRDEADTVALAVLGWILQDTELAQVFLGATGADPAALRDRLGDADLHVAVLEFVMMDDAWVCAAADHAGCAPADLARARAALPGADVPHWS